MHSQPMRMHLQSTIRSIQPLLMIQLRRSQRVLNPKNELKKKNQLKRKASVTTHENAFTTNNPTDPAVVDGGEWAVAEGEMVKE